MKVKAKLTALVLLVILSIAALTLTVGILATPTAATVNDSTKAELLSGENIVLVPGEKYRIIFSSDTNQLDAEFAMSLANTFAEYGQMCDVYPDYQSEYKYEILIGNTTRALSEELLEACRDAAVGDKLVWGFAFKDGKFAFSAISDESFSRGTKAFAELFVKSEGFVVEEDMWLIMTLSRAEYEEELRLEEERLEAEKEAARLENIEKLKEAIDGFTYSDFTDFVTLDYTVMPKSVWGSPNLYPTEGEHPRLNVTPYMLENIREYIKTSEGKFFYEYLVNLADTEYTGVLPPAKNHATGRIGVHNMDEKGLAIIEARAFVYLLTGDEYYAYSAILAMKNYLKTIDIQKIHSDQCREFGRIMYCTAEIYDWCYYLLDEEDKNQFIVAITDICASRNQNTDFGNQMEVGYPPSGQGSVSGHGSEHQILRDYLAASIAIYDENPSWYEYVAGRVYNDYVKTRNYYYQSGTYQQGIFNYGPFRHNADLWSAWLLLCATGENPYVDELQLVTHSFFNYQVADGSFFGTGDGSRPQSTTGTMIQDAVLVAALYGDTVLKQRVLGHYNYFGGTNYSGQSVGMSSAHMIILCASYYTKTGTTDGTPIYENKPTITYNASPISQMIARSKWGDASAPAIFMKIGERSTANHEHADAGTFQIFYKGLYSGESGVYDSYGSTHFAYYHQATVAHNGLLIFNPDSADTELKGGSVDSATNASRVFYSGGQRRFGEIGSLNAWLNDSRYDTGYTLGYEYAFNADGSADYAYLAGDISPAYNTTDTSYVGRRMLSIFTGDESYPMLFIVYDAIKTAKDTFVNKFLLHTQTEPVVDEDAKTVTVTSKDGRLVLHSLKGGDLIEALGGENRNYLINGVQCAGSGTGSDKMWGRVELSNTGSTFSEFLTFMYVTDATNDEKLNPTTFENDLLIGTSLGSTVIVFAKSEERNAEKLSFTTEGDGIVRYFISGLYEGTWNVFVDGVAVAHRVSTVDGGMITFHAPAGEISIEPGKDIAPSNGGRIIYNSFGGILPDDAPQVYEVGVTVKLPEHITRNKDEFLGWYTSASFEEDTKVTEITATEKGKIFLYAKYKSFPVIEDYSDKSFAFGERSQTVGGISYVGKNKAGSWFEVREDEESKNRYLAVSRTETDMQIDVMKSVSSYIGTETCITYEIDLALDGDKAPITSTFRLRESTNKQLVTLFATLGDGSVTVGGTTVLELSEDFQKVIVTVDFANKTITAYNRFGDAVAKTTFSVPSASAAADTLEWASCLQYTFNWWMGGGESILTDNIKVYTGVYDPGEIVFPEGENRIIYNTGAATLPAIYPLTYKVGTPTELPTPNIAGGVFMGWYTTPTFEKGTEISVIDAENADAPINVYAKCTKVLLDADFTNETANFNAVQGHLSGSIQCQIGGKTGTTVKTVTDAQGNTYVEVYTDSSDGTLNNYAGVSTPTFSAGGKLTYVVDLANHSSGRLGKSQFRIRATSSSDILTLFKTENGIVYLGGDSSVKIATLSDEFTRIAITIDIYANTLTAYDRYGETVASRSVSAPNGASLESWLPTVVNAFNWYFSKSSAISFDNISITSGEYIPEKEVIPDGHVKVNYSTGGGTFTDEKDRYVPTDSAFILPTDITKPNYVFKGWYTSATFEEGTLITQIPAGTTGEFNVYARWLGKSYTEDFTGKENATIKETNGTLSGTALYFAAKGKTDACLSVMKDEKGNEYLVFNRGADSNDPQLKYNSALSLGTDGKVTYHISLALPDEGTCMASAFRIRSYKQPKPTDDIPVFTTTADGKVKLGGVKEILTLTNDFTDIIITVDFINKTLTAYTASGEVIDTVNHSKDLEWAKTVDVSIYLYASGGNSIKMDNLWIAACGYDPSLL